MCGQHEKEFQMTVPDHLGKLEEKVAIVEPIE